MLKKKELKVLTGQGLFQPRRREKRTALTVEWLDAKKQPIQISEKKGTVYTGPPPLLGRVQHPENLQNFEQVVLSNAVVNAAINVLTEMTVGVGYFTEAENENAKKAVDDYAEQINFDGLIRVVCRNCYVYGFSPVECWWEGKTLMLKPLPPKTVYVLIDPKGKLKGYQQKTWSGSFIDFSLDEIIWFSPSAYPGNPYGIGKVGPIYTLAQYRTEILQNFALIVKRHARPPAVWLSRYDPTKLKEEAAQRTPDQDFFIGPLADPDRDLKIIIPDFDPRGQYADLLELINQEIYEGLQAPLLTWLKNSTEASAKVQLEAIQRYVAGVQRYFKRVVEGEIFAPIVKKFGYSEVPRLRWGMPSTGVENLTIRDVTELVNSFVIDGKQARELLRKMGLPIEEPEKTMGQKENVKPRKVWRVEQLT